MTHQTIEFLAENFNIHKDNFIEIQRPPAHIVSQNIIDNEGQLSLRIYDVLDTNVPPIDNIKWLCEFLDSSYPSRMIWAGGKQKIPITATD
jgi:hypothetical protein